MIQCHYDVLSVPRDADIATIKKAHRKLVLQFHPDKNIGNDVAVNQFRLVQQAYETLSDPRERRWYDEHRDAIMKGWSGGGGGDDSNNHVSILFDVVPYQYAGCYNGYDNNDGGFFAIYRMVFQHVRRGEEEGWTSEGNAHDDFPLWFLSDDFGNVDAEWDTVSAFYKGWESFTSCLGFAWADPYDTTDAPDRRTRRAMEEENKRARRKARRERNEDISALVYFCKRRDPRVKASQERLEQERRRRDIERKKETERKRAQAAQARESWKIEQEQAMADFEEEDRIAGRVRLADLDDDYEYGGGKRGKKGKKKNKRRSVVSEEEDEDENDREQQSEDISEQGEAQANLEQTAQLSNGNGVDGDVESTNTNELIDSAQEQTILGKPGEKEFVSGEESSESEPEPDVWRCEVCRKDFKSRGQMENHMNSKKHKVAFKKFQEKRKKEAEAEDLIDQLSL